MLLGINEHGWQENIDGKLNLESATSQPHWF